MALTVKPKRATGVLLAHAGWQAIQKGSLEFDTLELTPATPTSESEDYGFRYIASSGEEVMGRSSVLLAVREAATE